MNPFGKLTLKAFQHDAIEASVGVGMLIFAIAIVSLLTYYKRWKWLWHDWLSSLDPKRIGVMYIVVTGLMLFKGIVDAAMMRAQQVLSVDSSHGYLSTPHFQQLFTAHGTTMIFFVGMGVVFAVMNLAIPLQIGARDVAFPFLNSIGFWFFAMGAALLTVSLVVGNFAGTGWVSYPPLSGLEYNPGEGVDYWIWSLQIAGVGSLISGINFIVTIFKMRCPGMTFWNMPVLIWALFGCLVLIIFAFPILTATISMLALDRVMGMHFFTPDFGGNPMMYINLFWAWGHPEVYILVLPAFGIFSEVVATFSQKKLFGYASMVWAIIAITFLSFIVWVHHFFTMGAGAKVNAFFGIMTMLIAVPTGVKIFNWLFTMYRGKVHFTTPMIWFFGFILTFSIGGMTGVLMSIAPVDFQVHNSLFLVAHFHSVIIGGVLFGFFSGFAYWFPKIAGFTLNERLGRYAAYLWISGFLLAFTPLYILGLMGATRRLDHYDSSTGWAPLFGVAAFGVVLILSGFCMQVLQLLVSIKDRKKNKDTTGDPWNGRTLEWATTSPPPLYNFAILPEVHGRDPFWAMKYEKHHPHKKPHYHEFHMPKNTPLGMYIGLSGFVVCFAIVWHIWWMAALGLIGVLGFMIARLFEKETDFYVTVEEIKKIEGQ